jgi:predicted  nucleic acid-binding Zn-ribbon protein
VVLSVEQMTALDNNLSALAEEKQTLTDEIASLREQVSNLQKADGDETSHIEDGAVVDMSHLSRAKADYERMKHLN